MSMDQDLQMVSVDVVADIICPWCYLGKRRLDRALEAVESEGIVVRVTYRPFFLEWDMPDGGMSREDYLASKFSDPESVRRGGKALREDGAAEGINFAFDKITWTPNTLDAHRLILWARREGLQAQIAESLFRLYFLEGINIGERDVLREVAGSVGMNVPLVSQLLDSEEDVDRVKRDVKHAYRIGVSGVPTFILNDRYGLVGAQDTHVLVEMIRKLSSGEVLTPQTPPDAE